MNIQFGRPGAFRRDVDGGVVGKDLGSRARSEDSCAVQGGPVRIVRKGERRRIRPHWRWVFRAPAAVLAIIAHIGLAAWIFNHPWFSGYETLVLVVAIVMEIWMIDRTITFFGELGAVRRK